MPRNHPLRLAIALLLASLCLSSVTAAVALQGPKASAEEPAATTPPKAEVEAVTDTIHGVEVTDPYRWLEDQNSARTRAWINAENAYTDSVLSRIPGRPTLKEKVTALLKTESMSTPRARNGRYFFLRRSADQDQSRSQHVTQTQTQARARMTRKTSAHGRRKWC